MQAKQQAKQAKQKARNDRRYELALEKGEEIGVSSHWVKRREHLNLGSELGKGSWGTVYRCRHEQLQYWDDNKSYAAKLICPAGMVPEEASQLRNEIVLWSAFDHPHCVHFRGVIFDVKDGGCCLLCDYMSGGSLFGRQRAQRESNAPPPSTEVLVAELLQVAEGALHLHQNGIVHRDLKSPNVLIHRDGRLCISDFGLARRLVPPRGNMTAETGSYRWMAPEVTLHKQYGLPCDVYSFAMLCTELLNRTVPFPDMDPVRAAGKAAQERWRPTLPQHAPTAIVALCRACWEQEPEARLTFENICASLASYAAPTAPAAVAHTAAAHMEAAVAHTPAIDTARAVAHTAAIDTARPAHTAPVYVVGADASPGGQEGLGGCENPSGQSRARGISPQSTILFTIV